MTWGQKKNPKHQPLKKASPIFKSLKKGVFFLKKGGDPFPLFEGGFSLANFKKGGSFSFFWAGTPFCQKPPRGKFLNVLLEKGVFFFFFFC